jgi:hypothetical protein
MGPKIAIGVLVVFLVLFIVVFHHGATRSGPGERPPADSVGRKQAAADYQPSPWTTRLGGLLAPFSPKLKLAQNRFSFGALQQTISVPAAKETFRNATFRVAEGCRTVSPTKVDCSAVSIHYGSRDGKGHDLGLDSQDWKGKNDDPTVGSLVILESGGELSFRCAPPFRCTVMLE